ncbi:unnamed protein product [Plutella xylostella]|uniref:(diamondback moth) hypothetical protein n=1 Tax=Plutella xylostella TaxID=51655 RepID=A0A8S4G4C7_PLUXY|nr:unnamed protein product [Plutella xylostella]
MEDQPKESLAAQNAENTKGDILAGDIPKAGDDLNDPDASKIDGSGDALKETSDEVTKLCMESEDTVDPSKATPNKASEHVPEGHDNVCSPKTVDATSDLQKPKPFDMKSLNNETELNSEDIELKWDDDEDGDNVVDDKTPGLIEKLNLIDDKISNKDDYLDKAADTTPMDVDETEKEEVLPPEALDSEIKLSEHTETAITDAKVETNSNRQTDDSDGKIDTPVASTDDVEMDSSNISSFVKESIKKELEGKVLDAETSDSVNMTEKMETDLVNDELSSTSILEHKNTNDDNIKTMIENEVNTMMSPTEKNVDGAPSIDTTLLHKTSIGTLSLEGQSIPNDDPGPKIISESTVATVENLQKDMPEPFISKDIDDPSVETPVPSKAQSDDIDITTDTAENVALSTEISEIAVSISISTLKNPIDSSDTIKNVELVLSEVSATNVNSSVKKDSSNEKEFVDSTHTKKEIENLSPTAKDVEKCKNMGPIATLDDVNNGFALQSSKTMMEPKETVTNTEPITSKEEKIEVDTAKANAANDITDTVQNTMEIDTPAPAVEPKPSTSKAEDESIEPQDIKTECPEPVKDSNPADFDPSSSNEGQLDESDEIQEMADSLGLLAESSRIMDDEEDEEEDADDDDDADADEDQDDESNLMTAEQSEDSNNAQTSETDAPKDATADIDISENSFAGKIVQKETEVAVEAEEKERDIAEEAGETETDVAEDTEADIAEEADADIGESEIAAADDVIEDAAEAEVKDAELDVDIDDMVVEEIEIVGKPLTPVEEATPAIAAVEPVVEASDVNPPAQEGVSSVQLSELSADTSWDSVSDREKNTILKRLLDKDSVAPPLKTLDLTSDTESPRQTRSTSKAEKKTEVLEPDNIVNIVDFGEISSEDDIQEVNQEKSKLDSTTTKEDPNSSVTSVNIPKDLDIISAASGNTSQIVEKDGETIIKGVPKPAPPKMARLNTSEISIKTTTASAEPNIVIPETTQNGSKAADKSKFGLEVFSLDSDEEEEAVKENTDKPSDRGAGRCINPLCPETCRDKIVADAGTLRYYDIERKRKAMVCQDCADVVALRLQGLISGVRSSCGLLQLPMARPEQQLVEISDSEEEEEDAPRPPPLGAAAAGFLEAHLADMINRTWHKYDLDERLLDARAEIEMELEHLEEERKEIDAMLNDCQAATDALRNELYATFTPRTQALPPIDIIDTPFAQYAALSDDDIKINQNENEVRRSKRPRPASIANKQERMSTDVKSESSTDQQFDNSSKMDDDNTDIKVVKLSAEAAPAGLPAAGELVRPALAPGQVVLAMRHAFGSWMRASVLEVSSKVSYWTSQSRSDQKQ